MNFAAVETLLAATSVAVFANASLTWAGAPISGQFARAYADELGISNSAPVFTCLEADASALAVDAAVAVVHGGASSNFTVREKQPDGGGIVRLVLQAA